ncbi:MAG TPA: VOC family protein [Candidatus Methylomirabilis sp.]|nr:VOC family protein [Candidatus Methylomirabilis sp.]
MAKAKAKTTRGSAKRPAPRKVSAIPMGYHTVTPYLTLSEGARALEFYGEAFGAKVKMRMDAPGGRLGHAELRIGDSVIMVSDEFPQPGGTKAPSSLGGSSGSLFVYVPNVDASFKRAVEAGCQSIMPPTDMFWGDRFGRLVDPFGHHWGLATHREDVSPSQMKKRAAAAMAQMGQPA